MPFIAGNLWPEFGSVGSLTSVDLFNESFLWASLVWGALGTAYTVYGWRQKAPVPLGGGLILTLVSIFVGNWIIMSLVSLAILGLVHWLLSRGW